MKGQVVFLFFWMFHTTCANSRRQQRRMGSGLDALMNNMGNSSNRVNNALYSYTPTTPRPEQVNCFVEIPATRVGGQCVRLGRVRPTIRGRRRMRGSVAWGCQSGIRLDISSSDCNRRSRRLAARRSLFS